MRGFLRPEPAPNKGRYHVCVIRVGLSKNNTFYSDAVLREAVPLFDGVRVFAKSDADHVAGRGTDVNNLIGRLVNPTFVSSLGTNSGAIEADLELIQPQGDIGAMITEATQRGMTDLFGLSIDVDAAFSWGRVDGRQVRIANKFTEVNSVDLIVEPGAGGRVVNLIEAVLRKETNPTMTREQIIALLTANRPDLLAGKDANALTDAELADLLGQAMKPDADCCAQATALTEAVD